MRGYYPALKNLRIGSRYRLSDEQLEAMALLLSEVFRKNVAPTDFPKELRDRLGLEAGQAFLLAAETGEQHFKQFEDFLGPVESLILQWRTWGREFGGKQPGPKATPDVERVIAQTGRVRTESLEIRPPLEARGREPAAKGVAPSAQKPIQVGRGQRQLPRTTLRVEPAEKPAASRQQFLGQLGTFSIDKLRPAGQPAVNKLQEIRATLQKVVAENPADQPAVAQALGQSPLFKLYQELGQESLRSQQPIDHVIYGRYSQGQPYLLREEFDAIGQLASIATPAPATVINQNVNAQ